MPYNKLRISAGHGDVRAGAASALYPAGQTLHKLLSCCHALMSAAWMFREALSRYPTGCLTRELPCTVVGRYSEATGRRQVGLRVHISYFLPNPPPTTNGTYPDPYYLPTYLDTGHSSK